MLITNVDTSDRLINGQLGYIYDFTISQDTALKTYIKFDDVRAELKVIQSEKLARVKNVVPIIRTEAILALPKFQTRTFKKTQFPIMLPWVCPILKVQGFTLENLCVSLIRVNRKHLVMIKFMLHLVEQKILMVFMYQGKLKSQ